MLVVIPAKAAVIMIFFKLALSISCF